MKFISFLYNGKNDQLNVKYFFFFFFSFSFSLFSSLCLPHKIKVGSDGFHIAARELFAYTLLEHGRHFSHQSLPENGVFCVILDWINFVVYKQKMNGDNGEWIESNKNITFIVFSFFFYACQRKRSQLSHSAATVIKHNLK